MVSVTSITEQLCKQKLEDGWSYSEPGKKSALSVPVCLEPENEKSGGGGGGGEKSVASGNSKISRDSKFNNNVWIPGKAGEKENEIRIAEETEWCSAQIEQMPPKKKHRRSFSIPSESRYDGGSGFHKFQHSKSSLSAALLRPVAVRPCVTTGSGAASKSAATRSGYGGSSLHSDNSRSISGPPRSGISAVENSPSDTFRRERHRPRAAAFGDESTERPEKFRFSKSRASNVWCSLDETSSGDVCGSLASQTRSSNSDFGSLCQGTCATNPIQNQTPERKTGLKRRRDEDRPKLDFFKMIETAYENESLSGSISHQMGSKRCSKEDISSPFVGEAQNVDSPSPRLQPGTGDPCRTSPASPFISLHLHFLAEKGETGATGDEDPAARFDNRNTGTNDRDTSQRKNRSNDTRGGRVVKGDRAVGSSEFDLDLIENN